MCFGKLPFATFKEMQESDFNEGIQNKLVGQINVVRTALPILVQHGAIVFTSGILSEQPLLKTVCAAAANGAINACALALATELQGRARVNAVSPSMVADSVNVHGRSYDGLELTSMEDLVKAYRFCLSSLVNGKVIRLYREI
jgi:NAD(P)-dependent dehydrogenase (short-subunit alcohol dehydrogenase family)